MNGFEGMLDGFSTESLLFIVFVKLILTNIVFLNPQAEAYTLIVSFTIYLDDLVVETSRPVADRALQMAILEAVHKKL
jgi:hypothetical protein